MRTVARVLLTGAIAIVLIGPSSEPQALQELACPDIKIGGTLPLPCSMALGDYQRVLYTWINSREYTELGWAKDKYVRDTGPFILGSNYGTHPSVRIHYSPEVVEWLNGGRTGELRVGAMIIKEMFAPPAARLESQRSEHSPDEFEALVQSKITSWTIMIRDDQTLDGWFWAGPTAISLRGKTPEEYAAAIAATVDTNDYPFNFRSSSYGQADCLRCHSSAESQHTFVSLDNIEGDGLKFRVDQSWDAVLAPDQRPAGGATETQLFLNTRHGNSSAVTVTPDGRNLVDDALATPNPEFVRFFQLAGVSPPATDSLVRAFPGQWADHVPVSRTGPEEFLTSDNCMGCHGGLGGPPFGINMFLQTGANYGDGYNISPFGEWRWSPMGLAGRDPFFYSQLATELAILDTEFTGDTLTSVKNALVNTCLSCHGGMGQRQLLIDAAAGDDELDPNFRTDYVYAFDSLTTVSGGPPSDHYAKYGNLAREGISCTLCHRMEAPSSFGSAMPADAQLADFLFNYTTGQFLYTPPDVLKGPFDGVKVLPMEHALGITPEGSAFLRDSQMCGTCHVINLPNVDSNDFKFPRLDESAEAQADRLRRDYGVDYAEALTSFPHSIEQATFLEWQNSFFATDPAQFRSCQDCHMPRDFHSLDGAVKIDTLISQIASIQDRTYPEVEFELAPEEIDIPFRGDYRRHELVGLNAFLLETFDQFDPLLGVAITDYMTSASTGNRLAIENMVRQGEEETVELEVEIVSAEGGELTADVTVTNLVGHRFPSGVAFRRAWIELLVLDESKRGEVIWGSGRTNSVGLIVDGNDEPLPTELFEDNRPQPHYHGIPGPGGEPPTIPPVTSESQVQIYEEVTLNGDSVVTFSFIHRDKHPKDNRLLPRGWRPSDSFPSDTLRQFMEATDPKGVVGDPDYAPSSDFAGKDEVRYVITLPTGTDASDLSVKATMYYQAFQPYWLHRKFTLSPDSPDTQRLYFMTSRLNTQGTVIEDWKLRLVSATASVRESPGGEG